MTITGYLGASYDQFSVSNAHASRTGATSEDRVSDQSSRIIFGVKEDLGGGLAAIGQYDMRFNLDAAARAQDETTTNITANFAAGGNSHIGLQSASWGAVRAGRQDIYYVDTPSLLPGGLYLAANQQPVFHSLATANASRTPNLLWWVSPRMSGFEVTAAYSTQGLVASKQVEVESDMGGATTRRGSSTMLRLNYTNGPIDATVSTYNGVSDTNGQTAITGLTAGAAGATAKSNNDQKGTTLVVKYQVTPALKVAAGLSDEQQIAVAAAAAVVAAANNASSAVAPAVAIGDTIKARATAWSASYDLGAWNFAIAQSNRGNTKYNGVEQAATGLSLTSVAATYNFSKRTAAGLMFSTMKNDANQASGLFYQSSSAYGGQFANARGENQNITSVAVRHNF